MTDLDALVLGGPAPASWDPAGAAVADLPGAGGAAPSAQPGRELVAVVTREATLPAALGGVAADLRRAGAPVVVTVAAAPPGSATAPALPRAAAVARRLRTAGLAATAAGARCHVRLPSAVGAAGATVADVVSAAGAAPVVVAVCARDDEADRLLADADRLVLALPSTVDPALASLASTSLARLGPPVERCSVPSDPLGRTVAALGLRGLAAREPDDA